MPFGSSRVSPNTGRREWPAVRKSSSSSPSVASNDTDTMSTRGTITSSTRMRWKPSTFFNIARSCGEKFSSPISASASSRSSRIESRDFRPTRASRRSYQRARAPSLSEISPTRAMELRSSFMAEKFAPVRPPSRDRIGDPKPRQGFDLERLHDLRLGFGFVIVAEEVQDAVDNKVRRVVRQGLALAFRLARHRSEGERDIAERLASRHSGVRICRKGQNIRGLVLAAPGAIQGANSLVVGEKQAELDILLSRRVLGDRQRGLDGAARQSLDIAERRPALRRGGKIERDHGSRPLLRAGTIAAAASAS